MQLNKYEKNAKIHTDEQISLLAKMIARFGWRQPILVNSKNVIIAGHGRYMAYLSNTTDIKTPWVINDKGQTVSGKAETEELTEEEEKAYRHLDNLVNEMTKSDITIYSEEIKEIEDEELVSMFDGGVESLKNYKDAQEISLAKLEENKAGFNFQYAHSEYLELMQLIQNGIMQTGTETKEGLLTYLLQQYK